MLFKRFRKNKDPSDDKYGFYPCCLHLNNALRFLLKSKNPNRYAISEIIAAIRKADGFIVDDVQQLLYKEHLYS